MSMVPLIEYERATPEVKAVYEEVMAARKTNWVNNFWKALANHPPTLRRMWETIKEVMAPGALDPLTKEMLYIAVSVTNNCEYCIHSHTAAARAKGMTDAQFAELIAVVGLANETNRLANGYRIPVDEQFRPQHKVPAEALAPYRNEYGPVLDAYSRDHLERPSGRSNDRGFAFGQIGRAGHCDERIAMARDREIGSCGRLRCKALKQGGVALTAVAAARAAAHHIGTLRAAEDERAGFHGPTGG